MNCTKLNLIAIISYFALFSTLILSCKSTNPSAPSNSQEEMSDIQEKYWKLIELKGKPFVMKGGDQQQEPYFILKKEDNRVNGSTGCNRMMGTYTLAEGNRISFSQLAQTRMACVDMSVERPFIEVLETVDNYTIKGDSLSLNKARMAPLAKFVAVYF